jgi:hypothetical protein
MSNYIPPFSIIKKKLNMSSVKGEVWASAKYSDIEDIIRMYLYGTNVDEDWYVSNYPDVAEAIKSGVYASAKAHFVSHGYFEGRIPFPMNVDEGWYLKSYEDIAGAVKEGKIASAQAHFSEFGYAEGRLPAGLG